MSAQVVPGESIHRHFGGVGTVAILGVAGAGCFMLGWGLGRRAAETGNLGTLTIRRPRTK